MKKKHSWIILLFIAAVFVAGCEKEPIIPDVWEGPNPANWVDLGLPSGLLWATRNVGASSPEDYGYYFAWGETTPKMVYDWNTYRYCNGNYGQLTKYCNYSGYGYHGFTDDLTMMQRGDDAATAIYGGRTPTRAEWQELLDNTTSQWTTYNGVRGCLFIAPNGNRLFLPVAGRWWNSSLDSVGIRCYYWSRSLYTNYPCYAWGFRSFSEYQSVYYYNCSYGRSVRAVLRQN